jgi:hypothetical protein
MAQSAEPPQHGGDQPARQRAVAVSQRGKAGMSVFSGQKIVERNSPPQNAVENIGGNSSSGEAGNFRLGGSARTPG